MFLARNWLLIFVAGQIRSNAKDVLFWERQAYPCSRDKRAQVVDIRSISFAQFKSTVSATKAQDGTRLGRDEVNKDQFDLIEKCENVSPTMFATKGVRGRET